jgi:hypothetical protein
MLGGMAAMTGGTWGDAPPRGPRIPGGNPPMRPDQLAAQPLTRAGSGPAPQTGIVIARRVIIVGPDDGLFVYDGTPGPGTLIASIASAPGTDPYGNAYDAGVTTYSGAPSDLLSNLAAGKLTLSGPGAARPASVQWTPAGNGLLLESGSTSVSESQSAINLQDGSSSIGVPVIFFSGITQNSAEYSYPPSLDATGAEDTQALTAITAAIAATGYGKIRVLPGPLYLKSQITVPANAEIEFSEAAQVIPVAAMSSVFLMGGSHAALRNLRGYGGSTTRSANPAADLVSLAAGVEWVWVDVDAAYINGAIINPAGITGATHWSFPSVRGYHCASGITLAAAGAAVTAQITMNDLDIQQTEVGPCLSVTSLFDLAVSQLNAACLAGTGTPTVQLLGCSTVSIYDTDIGFDGTSTTAPTLLLDQDGAGNKLTDCHFFGGTVQDGLQGVMIGASVAGTPGATALTRCTFHGIESKNNSGDAWQINGSGDGIAFDACTGNGTPAGSYDFNITGLAHVMLDKCIFASTLAADAYNIVAAGNHVSVVNPTFPGGKAGFGNAPNGW